MGTKKISEDVLTIKLLKAHTLIQVEEQIRKVSQSTAKDLDVWLARDLGPKLFKDTRIVCLLAAAASRGMRIRVIDWYTDVVGEFTASTTDRFGTTLEGIASLEYATNIVNSQKTSIDDLIRHLKRVIIEKDGIKTPEKTSGQALTFCAFDPDEPIPLGFVGFDLKSTFMSKFREYRRNCFEVGAGAGFSDRIPPDVDNQLAAFAYEIWQNSFQHGRLDRLNKDIAGVRYLRIQKHVDYSKAMFLERATGFAELQSYLDREIQGTKAFTFYEVTIADNGLGIVERFLATRPDHGQGKLARDAANALINLIIDQALSSKLSQSGAGHGLEQAIEAVRKLRGFISVRSGNSWLYQAFHHDVVGREGSQLLNVDCTSALASVGTQINLLFPLTDTSKR
jgi:hypothetical protein